MRILLVLDIAVLFVHVRNHMVFIRDLHSNISILHTRTTGCMFVVHPDRCDRTPPPPLPFWDKKEEKKDEVSEQTSFPQQTNSLLDRNRNNT